jgi:phospholipid/cholesterol/gamma-HCH transport system substrate-binding protein
VPVKTDSHVKIMSISPLGDNHIEILPGTQQAALAAVGALLPSDPYIDFNALTAQINDIAPQVKNLLRNLNDRAADLKVTIDRVNSLLSNENRANLSATLADTRGLIEENRPQLRATLQHINTVSEKLEPLLQDFQKTSKQANETLDHIDAMVGENRADVRQAVIELRKTLTTMTDLTGRLDQTLEVNSDNLDEVLDNLRHVTENLKQFTDTIKKRPYTLIRSSNPPEHKTGEKQ